MAIVITQKESPLFFQDTINGKIVYSGTYSGMVSKLEELAKIYDAPVGKKVKEVLEICEHERLEGGSDFKETEGPNSGPQVRKYLAYVGVTVPAPWCAALVCWVMGQAKIDFIKTADTWEMETYAKNKKILTDTPSPGAIFLQINPETGRPVHTGFVKEVDPTDKRYLLTIEGNAGDSIKHCNDKKVTACKYIRW